VKITILGCGSSGGVPLIGGDWGACDPNDPRNRRTRVSVLVEEGETRILIDASPDLREQALACGLRNLSAVIFTHSHADHCHGIDELRSFTRLTRQPIPVYADPQTLKELETRFDYIFHGSKPDKLYKPVVTPHAITGPFEIGGIPITPFAQDHINMQTLGLRLGDFAYSTDVKNLDEAAFAVLAGVKVWAVDCVREKPHPTHSHLAQTLEWIARLQPKRAILTHMNETLDYKALAARLPRGVEPAYDGLVVEC
jgi:phosphoribosyl 1,2-cyclic phosphate phosphodiesterase